MSYFHGTILIFVLSFILGYLVGSIEPRSKLATKEMWFVVLYFLSMIVAQISDANDLGHRPDIFMNTWSFPMIFYGFDASFAYCLAILVSRPRKNK